MTDFTSFGLSENIKRALDRMQIKTPTKIQEEAIPPALQGRNILGSAQTGTGKTLAYMIPIVTGLTNNPGSIAIILTPTRELASQVRDAWNDLTGMDIKLKTALLIGGQPMPRQCDQLQKSPRLIVGTPGRVNDHLKRKTLKLDQARFFVLDETDRMLDMGFSEQIQRIERYIPKKRQTFMFSATFPDNILSLAKKYLTDPVRISIGEVSKPVERIRQEVIKTSTSDKFPFLLKELDHREGSIIIFVKTKHGAKNLANKLYRENHSVDAIHGNLHQPKRDRVLREFRTSRKRILVATDVAARGLDIPHVMHVINYDIPQCADDYIHRIGRTGRAGAEGNALCFVSSMDTQKWSRIYKSVNF